MFSLFLKQILTIKINMMLEPIYIVYNYLFTTHVFLPPPFFFYVKLGSLIYQLDLDLLLGLSVTEQLFDH